MKEVIIDHAETGYVVSKKEGKVGLRYPVVKCYIKDLFGRDREFKFFVNRTDMQFLGLDIKDFDIEE